MKSGLYIVNERSGMYIKDINIPSNGIVSIQTTDNIEERMVISSSENALCIMNLINTVLGRDTSIKYFADKYSLLYVTKYTL